MSNFIPDLNDPRTRGWGGMNMNTTVAMIVAISSSPGWVL